MNQQEIDKALRIAGLEVSLWALSNQISNLMDERAEIELLLAAVRMGGVELPEGSVEA